MSINNDIKEKFKSQYKRGLEGLNKGIPIPLTKLSEYICNIQQGTITLVGGSTGSGKSTLINEVAISAPLQFLEDNPDRPEKYHCEYFNLEIQDVDVLAKFKANYIFKESQYQIKLSPTKIFQKGDFILTDVEKDWIDRSDRYIDKLMDNVDFVAGENVSPEFFYKKLWECAKKYGTMECDADGKPLLHTWKAIDPNQYVVFIFDNLNNLNDKSKIDTLSSMCVTFRKLCNFTFFLIQQYNRSQETNFNHGGFQEPVLSDLKESGRTSDDADTVILTYSPARFGITEYLDYQLEELLGNNGQNLGDILRFAKIAKNRNGQDNKYIPYAFSGARGIIKELPSPFQFSTNHQGCKENIINLFC